MVARRRCQILWAFILVIFLCFCSSAISAKESCSFIGAEYVPRLRVDKDADLNFILRITQGDGLSHTRTVFLNFVAFNKAGEKLSGMRFGNTWSNGRSRESFSSYYGAFCDFSFEDSNCASHKKSAVFYPIGLNKDLERQSIHSAPDLIIFPETEHELTYSSYQFEEDWDTYIEFYTKDRVYPDFRGYDFWYRTKCGGFE